MPPRFMLPQAQQPWGCLCVLVACLNFRQSLASHAPGFWDCGASHSQPDMYDCHVGCNVASTLFPCRLVPLETTTPSLVEEAAPVVASAVEQHHPHDSQHCVVHGPVRSHHPDAHADDLLLTPSSADCRCTACCLHNLLQPMGRMLDSEGMSSCRSKFRKGTANGLLAQEICVH